MKMSLFNIANCLFFVLCSPLVFAQPVSTTNTSSPSTCDGFVQFVDSSSVISTSIYWSDSSSVIQQGGFYLYGLCPGVYTVTYSDTSATNQTYTFTIGSGSSNPCSGFYATASAAPSTDSTNCDGSVMIYPYGGSSPYSYNWGNAIAGNVSSAINVCAGAGYCIVTDANGCNYTVQYNISDSSGNGGNPCSGFYVVMNVTPSTSNTFCDEAATVSVFGGTAPYSYNWNNSAYPDSTISLSYVCEGNYTCIVTDASGCVYTATGSADTTSNGCSGFYATVSVSPSSDSLNCNGSASVLVSGGTAPFLYVWNSPITDSLSNLNNLCPGTYVCSVTDGNGCVYTVQANITDSTGGSSNPCAGFYAYASTYPTSDSLSCNGIIEVSAYGGSGTYTYTMATGASNTTGTFANLCPGNYAIVVSDTNGCIYTVSETVVDSSYYFPDSSNIISNPTYGDSTITDTLDYSWIYDCAYDLGSVDSAYILSNVLSGADSVIVTWILIDSTGQNIGSYEVWYATGGSSGVVSVFLTVICPMHSPGDNALMASDQIYLPGASAGVNESNLYKVTVVNPFDTELVLTFAEKKVRKAVIYDLKGAVVAKETSDATELHINTMSLEKGMYVLSIQEGTNVYQTKLVK